ncbi:MAG: hypothetical protein AAFX39_04055 [Pseudomonadota bacterium]
MDQASVSNEFWRAMDAESKGFDQPAVLRRPFTSPPVDESDVREIFHTLSKTPGEAKLVAVRVYIDGRLCHESGSRLIDHPPRPDETLEAWSQRVLDQEKIGIFVGNAAYWSEQLARKCANLVQPLLSRYAPPHIGFDSAIFIGNYGYTPVGAHVDNPHHRILHFQLGPNKKQFIFWDNDVFFERTGSRTGSFDFEGIIKDADVLEISAGDAILIPSRIIHVAGTCGFSVAVSLVMSRNTRRMVLSEALKTDLVSLAETPEDDSDPDFLHREAIDFGDIQVVDGGSKAQDWLADIMNDYQLLKASNCSLHSAPSENRNVPEDLDQSTVQLVKPFPILMREQADKTGLFVRQRRFFVSPNAGVSRLVDRLNSGRPSAVAELHRDLSAEMEPDTLLQILKQLIRFRAIDILTEAPV